MVQINFAQKSVTVKVVYYGPGMSGKTTNLEVVHQRAPDSSRGDLTSISTDGDRTLFFDFMPLDLGTVAGMRTQFQIYTVPGQVYYNSTRKLVLQGVDGVIFIADSSASMMEENLESLRNLQDNLAEYGKDMSEMPMVIQYNKRDLPDALPVEQLEAALNPFGAPSFEACANTGQGVFPTLKAIAATVLDTILAQTGTSGGVQGAQTVVPGAPGAPSAPQSTAPLPPPPSPTPPAPVQQQQTAIPAPPSAEPALQAPLPVEPPAPSAPEPVQPMPAPASLDPTPAQPPAPVAPAAPAVPLASTGFQPAQPQLASTGFHAAQPQEQQPQAQQPQLQPQQPQAQQPQAQQPQAQQPQPQAPLASTGFHPTPPAPQADTGFSPAPDAAPAPEPPPVQQAQTSFHQAADLTQTGFQPQPQPPISAATTGFYPAQQAQPQQAQQPAQPQPQPPAQPGTPDHLTKTQFMSIPQHPDGTLRMMPSAPAEMMTAPQPAAPVQQQPAQQAHLMGGQQASAAPPPQGSSRSLPVSQAAQQQPTRLKPRSTVMATPTNSGTRSAMITIVCVVAALAVGVAIGGMVFNIF